MTDPVPFQNLEGRNLGSRRKYFESMRKLGSDTLSENIERLAIRLQEPPAGLSTATSYNSYRDVSGGVFDLLIADNLGVANSEASQPIAGADGERMFFFHQIVPILSISGFVYDTGKDWVTDAGEVVPGDGHAKMLSFYERARLSQVVKRKQVVRVEISGEVYWGAFISKTAARSSSAENKVDVSLTMLVFAQDRLTPDAIDRIPNVDADGRITAEGAAKVGLLAHEVTFDFDSDAAAKALLPPLETVERVALDQNLADEIPLEFPDEEEFVD